ncbi:MAG TPA: response regulator, partial [Candidatus Polarisedimenticolia bacterium]|nr:response regulator [Candidatus Polarisedimenticolia bacterium]
LLVEDDGETREQFASALRSAGAQVWAVGSTREGLEMLGTVTPDLLVADVGGPGQEGAELIGKVRALVGSSGHVPAVAITADARRDHQRARAAGYDAHLGKPVEPDRLRRVVARLFLHDRAS